MGGQPPSSVKLTFGTAHSSLPWLAAILIFAFLVPDAHAAGLRSFPASSPGLYPVPSGNHIRPRNDFFAGREDILQRINQTLGPRNTQNTARGVVLHGVSGIGKTEIALDYAHQVYVRYDPVFWIDATNHETAIDSMHHSLEILLKICQRPDLGRAAQCQDIMHTVGMGSVDFSDDQDLRHLIEKSFLSWLSFRDAPPWLLILDNLHPSDSDDLAWPANILRLLRASPRSNAIITTRCVGSVTGWDIPPEWAILEVGRMSENEALELLDRRTQHLLHLGRKRELVNAKRLVRVFGYHPFAISLAGGYMKELQYETPQQDKVFSYMKLFGNTCSDNTDRWISLQLPGAFTLNRVTIPHSNGTTEQDGVRAALGVILSGMAKEDRVAVNILTILGFLSPATGVWPALLGYESMEGEKSALFHSEDRVETALLKLWHTSVLQEPFRGRYAFHPLVKDWSGSKRSRSWLANATPTAVDTMKLWSWNNPTLAFYHPKVLRHHLGDIYPIVKALHPCSFNTPIEAQYLFDQAMRTTGRTSWPTLDDVDNGSELWGPFMALGQAMTKQQSVEVASWLFCLALNTRQFSQFGVLLFASKYGYALQEAGRHGEAEAWYRRLLDPLSKHVGPDDLATSTAYIRLGLSTVDARTKPSCSQGISQIIRGLDMRTLAAPLPHRNDLDVQAAILDLAHALSICLVATGIDGIRDGNTALFHHTRGQSDRTKTAFDNIARVQGNHPLIQRWINAFRANKHFCNAMGFYQYFDKSWGQAVPKAFLATRMAKHVFDREAEFPPSWGTGLKWGTHANGGSTSFPFSDAARLHESNAFEEGCETARTSAQICLWQDLISRDALRDGCDGSGSHCFVNWAPSPFGWDDPLEGKEVESTLAWPVVSWSRPCAKLDRSKGIRGLEVYGPQMLERYLDRRDYEQPVQSPPVGFAMKQKEWSSNGERAVVGVQTVVESLKQLHKGTGPMGQWLPPAGAAADEFFVGFLPIWIDTIAFEWSVAAHLVLAGYGVDKMGPWGESAQILVEYWMSETACPGRRRFGLGLAEAVRWVVSAAVRSRFCYLPMDERSWSMSSV